MTIRERLLGDQVPELPVLEGGLEQVEAVNGGVPTQGGQQKLRDVALNSVLAPLPQVLEGLLIKYEPSLDLL